MNIFVAKLDFQTQEAEVRDAFEAFGAVDSVKIIMDKHTNRSKGYGFVEMPNDEEGRSAINSLNDSELSGRTIVVKEARPRDDYNRDNRRGGGGGGGYQRRDRY